MERKTVVIALGGNALGKDAYEQKDAVANTAKVIVDLAEQGLDIVVTHGNGPQVGMIYNAMAAVDPTTTEDDMPFPECGAMSQGYIGYHLQQAMEREFKNRNMRRRDISHRSSRNISVCGRISYRQLPRLYSLRQSLKGQRKREPKYLSASRRDRSVPRCALARAQFRL